MQGGSRIKNYRLGSIKTKFYYDINCLSGSASRNTKRSCKRLASRLIKRLSQEEV